MEIKTELNILGDSLDSFKMFKDNNPFGLSAKVVTSLWGDYAEVTLRDGVITLWVGTGDQLKAAMHLPVKQAEELQAALKLLIDLSKSK